MPVNIPDITLDEAYWWLNFTCANLVRPSLKVLLKKLDAVIQANDKPEAIRIVQEFIDNELHIYIKESPLLEQTQKLLSAVKIWDKVEIKKACDRFTDCGGSYLNNPFYSTVLIMREAVENNTELAWNTLERLYSMRNKISDSREAGELLVECGWAAYKLQNRARAAQLFEEANRRYNTRDHQVAVVFCILGGIYWDLNQQSKALVAWRNSISRFSKLSEQRLVPTEADVLWYQAVLKRLNEALEHIVNTKDQAQAGAATTAGTPAAAAGPSAAPGTPAAGGAHAAATATPATATGAPAPAGTPAAPTSAPGTTASTPAAPTAAPVTAGIEPPITADTTQTAVAGPVEQPEKGPTQEPSVTTTETPSITVEPVTTFSDDFLAMFPILEEVPAGPWKEVFGDPNITRQININQVIIDNKPHYVKSLHNGDHLINLAGAGKHVVIKITGNSMNAAKPTPIEDGDYALVRVKESANSNDIVVAKSPDEATGNQTVTIKRFKNHGHPRLIPESTDPQYGPLEGKMHIFGVVVAIFKPMDKADGPDAKPA